MPLVDNSLLESIGVDKPLHRKMILKAVEQLKSFHRMLSLLISIGQQESTTSNSDTKSHSQLSHSDELKPQRSQLYTKLSMTSKCHCLLCFTNRFSNSNQQNWIVDSTEFEFTAQVGKSGGKDKVGSGTSGKVYRALFKGMDVAIKVLKPPEDETEADEFRKEFEIMWLRNFYISV